MRSDIFFAGLAAPIVASALSIRTDEAPLSLEITQIGNSAIKATLTNTADRDFKLLRSGSILDDNLIEKSQVFSAGKWINPLD